MEVIRITDGSRRTLKRGVAGIAVASGLVFGSASFADDSYSMAPPIQTDTSQSYASTGADSVFNWQEVPVNEQVPISRASFDQGGYQLYDTRGETIVVPFTNQNLYVMKFGQTDGGGMYFVNEGDTPVLYVPRDGYVENATVSGARWYPFGKDFRPSHPVFLGIAPSWSVFVGMGWYPHMSCYGGYWSERPWFAGSVFLPSIGLFFEIGGRSYHGWDGYRRYYNDHPTYYRTAYYRRDFYRWDRRPGGPTHQFRSFGHDTYQHRGFDSGHQQSGAHSYDGGAGRWQRAHGTDGGHSNRGSGTPWQGGSQGGGHVFHGGFGTWHGNHNSDGGHQNNTGAHQWNSGGGYSPGGHTSSGGGAAPSGRHQYSGGGTSGGGTFGGGRHTTGGAGALAGHRGDTDRGGNSRGGGAGSGRHSRG